jgi:hypothetical protein
VGDGGYVPGRWVFRYGVRTDSSSINRCQSRAHPGGYDDSRPPIPRYTADGPHSLRHYTPFGNAAGEGVLAPLEVHSNTPYREVSADRPLILFPMPMGEPVVGPQSLTVLIVWVDEGALSSAEGALLSAAEAMHHRREAEAIVSAASAVELAVGPFVSQVLERVASPKASRELLRRAGLAGQIDVLLPLACSMLGAPTLPEEPAAALRQLRRLRNRAAHEGEIPSGTTRKEVAKAVASAIFLIGHVNILTKICAEEEG